MNQDTSSLIIYEDPHIIVCRKPAGVPTQSSRIGTRDMVSLLKNHLADASSSKNKNVKSGQTKEPYLAVIHRLDQPVEGLLVFAKTPAAARELSRQLTGSGFGKYYLAAVHGSRPRPKRTWKITWSRMDVPTLPVSASRTRRERNLHAFITAPLIRIRMPAPLIL